MVNGKSLTLCFLLALPLLMGAQCAFVATSGTSKDDDEDKPDSGLVVIINDGQLIDAAVQGVGYASGSVSGITGPNGEFQYQVGHSVRFRIGNIELGEAVEGKTVITPLDLVPGGNIDTPAVINIARLLQSLDSVQGDNRISIPPTLRAAAVRSNESIASYLQFLDFSDTSTFETTASQLVATLTAGYPFTAVLVDTQSAKTHLRRYLEKAGTEVTHPDGQL